MNESSWLTKFLSDPLATATLILALVTAVLAFAAFRSISQNNNLQKRERKERLLNEIIEWGESIRKSSFVSNLEEMIIVLKLTGDDKRRVWALKNEYEYLIVSVRYHYIKRIASELDVSLLSAIEDVSATVAKHIYLLRLEYDGKTKENDVSSSIDKIKESINKMIDVAVGLLPK